MKEDEGASVELEAGSEWVPAVITALVCLTVLLLACCWGVVQLVR